MPRSIVDGCCWYSGDTCMPHNHAQQLLCGNFSFLGTYHGSSVPGIKIMCAVAVDVAVEDSCLCMPRQPKFRPRNNEDCNDSCSMLRGFMDCFVGKQISPGCRQGEQRQQSSKGVISHHPCVQQQRVDEAECPMI